MARPFLKAQRVPFRFASNQHVAFGTDMERRAWYLFSCDKGTHHKNRESLVSLSHEHDAIGKGPEQKDIFQPTIMNAHAVFTPH